MDISIQNFEADLINASVEQPVLLDIWAPWCGPCKALTPVLEKLEVAYAGRFRLAKLNADEQPEISGQLSQMFGVRSIPFCVLFKGGQPVDGFVGALPEAQVREFLDRHVPSAEEMAADEDLAAAEELLAEGDADSALERLQEAVAIDPANDAARFDYVKLLLLKRSASVAQARTGVCAGGEQGDRSMRASIRRRAAGSTAQRAGGILARRRCAGRRDCGQQARFRGPLRARAKVLFAAQ